MLSDFYYPIIHVRHNLEIYIKKWDVKSLVVGESGGIDSGLCSVLARPVCDKLGIPLIGRSISIESNKPDERERARHLGEIFCTDFQELDFTDEYSYLIQSKAKRDPTILQNTMASKVRRGNLKARMRMLELYDIAGATGGMVLSTDNYTELLLGFWTLHGDVGDFGMIQKAWKTEVYRMSEFLIEVMSNGNMINFQNKELHEYPYPFKVDMDEGAFWLKKTVEAIPTDGLGITNSDLDQLMPDWSERFKSCREAYEEVDRILIDYAEQGNMTHANTTVAKRYERAKVKRANPINIPRSVLVAGKGITADLNFNDKGYPQLYA